MAKEIDGEKKKRFTVGKLMAVIIGLVVVVYMAFTLLLFGAFINAEQTEPDTAVEEGAVVTEYRI